MFQKGIIRASLLTLFCGMAFFCGKAKTAPTRDADSLNQQGKNLSHNKLTITDSDSQDNFNKGGWPEQLNEGWLDATTFQALVTTENLSREEALEKARYRLAWLLLIHDYQLTRSDESIAERLAKSKLLGTFGKEKIFETKSGERMSILVRRQDDHLKEDWKAIREKIEAKIPSLKEKRLHP